MQNNSLAKHVLIIDHEHSDELIIQKEHQLFKFNLLIISDFQKALDLMSSNFTPQVIVCNIDLTCNSITGLSFISNIRSNETWSRIPIIALSKTGQSSIILESLQLGAIDFLKCPYEPMQLLKRIQRAYRINRFQDSQHNVQTGNKDNNLNKLRKIYVETMKYAVLYWEISTKLTKIELAESSGLWSVYLDKNGAYRTRTMDRYLKEKKLPKNPKVKQIILTANYVLNHCQKQSIIKQKLKSCFYKLLDLEEISSEDYLVLKN